MRKFMKILFVLSIFLGLVTVPFTSYAASNGTNATLPRNETINNDYFGAGETVTLSGVVNGDAYVAGGNVVVEGTINGDLLVAGGTVTIHGKVRDDVRVAGGQIIISGDIGRNLTTVGGTVTITENAKINGSLTSATGNLSVFAPIGKEANIAGGQILLGNLIHGDVRAGVGNLTVLPSAKVIGNLIYWSDNTAQIEPGASISGVTTHTIPPKHTNDQRATKTTTNGLGVGFTIYSLFAALVIGILLTSFAPMYMKNTAELLITKPLLTFGTGFISLVLFPFIIVLLLFSVIGIPLDLMVIIGMAILIYLAKIIVAVAIGQKILVYMNRSLSLHWTLVMGLIVYYILSAIPLVGVVFWIIAGMMGLGALIIQKKNMYTEMRNKNII